MRLERIVLVMAMTGVAHADAPATHPEAIEVDRVLPPPGRAEFGFDGGAAVGAWAAAVDLGYVDRPLELTSGQLVTYPIAHRETVALGGALSLGDTGGVVVDARLPISHQVGSRLVGLGDAQALERWVAGDLALGARIRIAGGERAQTFVRLGATLPTGDDDNFAGEAGWTYTTQLIGRIHLPQEVVVAANAGILVRTTEVQIGDRTVGDALIGGIGVAVGVPPVGGLWCVPAQLRVMAELAGELGDKVGGQRGPSPAEARLGVVGRPLPELAVSVHAGLGLDDQIGSPRFRALLELTWQAPLAPIPPVGHGEPEPEDEED
jgi:hypothetical protein